MNSSLSSALSSSAMLHQRAAVSSSDRLSFFLRDNHLHKKDFADMIGVTLSYVYNLLDDTQPFSTRTTTLERIAIVMEADPATFSEYKGSSVQGGSSLNGASPANQEYPNSRLVDPGVRFLMQRQRQLGLSNVQLLKRLPKGLRLNMVDMWRGSNQLPLDWSQLRILAQVLEIPNGELYHYWQARLQQYLVGGGIEPMENMGLLEAMFRGARQYLSLHSVE
jgi:hypothetical protein